MSLWITTVEIQISRAYCLKTGRERDSGRPAAKVQRQKKDSADRAVFCKACGREITAAKQAISVHSSFRHTFFNPAGIVFELGCYRKAAGAMAVGNPSSEFSWFKGYLWSFALCSRCQVHLGWHFESATDAFWGLILNRLKE